MVTALVAVCVLWALSVVSIVGYMGRLLRGQQREANRNESLLLDRLLFVVGKPWNEAPAETVRRLPLERDDDPLWAAPEQHTPIV